MFGISENGSYLFSITIGYNQEAGQMSFRETSMGKCVVNGCNESYNHAATKKKSHILAARFHGCPCAVLVHPSTLSPGSMQAFTT